MIRKSRSLHKVREDATLFKLLANDQADVVIHELIGGKLLLQKLELEGVTAQLPPLSTPEMFLYLHRRRAQLVPKLAAALERMDAEGRRQAIIDDVLDAAGIR